MTPDEIRTRLFNLTDPIELSAEEFDTQWPLVSNIYTRWGDYKYANGDEWKVWACRLLKHHHSSTRKEGIPEEKRRKRKIRPAGQCFAKIKITKFKNTGIVRIERHNNAPMHSHSLEDSDKVKISQVVRELVEKEAMKYETPPEIVKAVKEIATDTMGLGNAVKYLTRKEVANIQMKIRKSQQSTDNSVSIGESCGNNDGPITIMDSRSGVGNEKILEREIQKAVKLLKDNGYYVERPRQWVNYGIYH